MLGRIHRVGHRLEVDLFCLMNMNMNIGAATKVINPIYRRFFKVMLETPLSNFFVIYKLLVKLIIFKIMSGPARDAHLVFVFSTLCSE